MLDLINFGWIFYTVCTISFVVWLYEAVFKRSSFFGPCIFLINFIVLLFTLMFYISEGIDYYDESSVVSDTIYIKSACLDSRLNGHFIIGTGNLNSSDVYKFYKKNDDGSFKLIDIPAESSEIKEYSPDSNLEPMVISKYYTKAVTNYGWFYVNYLGVQKEKIKNVKALFCDRTIIVPVGTVTENFSKINIHE